MRELARRNLKGRTAKRRGNAYSGGPCDGTILVWMEPLRVPLRHSSRPRIAMIGEPRDPLRQSGDALRCAIESATDAQRIAASSIIRDGFRAYGLARRAMRDHGAEGVHLLNARLAPAGLMLRRRHGVPVSVSLTTADLSARTPGAMLARRAVAGLDQAFYSGDDAPSRRLPIVAMPPIAQPLPDPSPGALAGVSRLLEGLTPGRLVIAMPWPADIEKLRWYRDAVVPLLVGRPVTLLLGAPSARQARITVGARGMRDAFRVDTRRLDVDVLSAAARCADAFALLGDGARGLPASDLATAMASSGLPLVTGGSVNSQVLAHEDNALTVEPGDAFGLVTTLNKLLSLPALQRHYLGAGFAKYTLSRWSPAAAAEAYAERFAVLVGRPPIPANLRAAA